MEKESECYDQKQNRNAKKEAVGNAKTHFRGDQGTSVGGVGRTTTRSRIRFGCRVCSKNQFQEKKKKNRSNQGTTHQNVVQNQETEFVEEVSSLTETSEVQENTQTAAITQSNVYDQASTRGRFNVESNRGRLKARGRGG